jgi:hypothetical protein
VTQRVRSGDVAIDPAARCTRSRPGWPRTSAAPGRPA